MTTEEKLDALYEAVNKAWDGVFEGLDWIETEENSNRFMLGEDTTEHFFCFFLAGCRDTYGGWIWVEYAPEENKVGIYIKDRPIQPYLKDDLKNLFEKHAPFGMEVVYEKESTPIIRREETVLPENLEDFFAQFKAAYDAHYALFYMFSVSAIRWYDGFCIDCSDC